MMGLEGAALEVATDMKQRFPELVFTSGRRTIIEQAKAMADNMVRNAKWIEQTYMLARAASECQHWADRHRNATADVMTTAFATIIAALPADEQRRLSRHLTGEAFDIRPIIGGIAEEVINALRDWETRRHGKFLTSEGGLVIWHWQAH